MEREEMEEKTKEDKINIYMTTKHKIVREALMLEALIDISEALNKKG